MKLTKELLIEASVVGVVLLILGKILNNYQITKKYHLEATLFLAGSLAHLFFEMVGFNKWYCKNSVACK
jgi:hypothetical protein